MIIKKQLNINLLKASVLGMLAFSAICPLWAQEARSLSSVNSPYDEQHPVISPSGDLFYTVAFSGNGNDPGDIWRSVKREEETFSNPSKVAGLSTIGLDVVVGFIDDHNILVYHDGKGKSQGIHHYIWNGSAWNYKEQLDMGSFRNQSRHFSGRLASSKDVMVLSLASFGSYGNEDIYVSFLKEGSTWTTPQNLGPSINTYQQEMTPYLSDDKQWLFFSTNGQGSTGGIDIYYTQRLGEGWENWSTPQPLSSGNTAGAELAYLPMDSEPGLAIYTSTQNSEGYGDIQMIRAERPTPEDLREQPAVTAAPVTEAQAEVEAAEETMEGEVALPPVTPQEPLTSAEALKEEVVVAEVAPKEPQIPVPAVRETPVDSVPDTPDNQPAEEQISDVAIPLKVLDINSLSPIAYTLSVKDAQGIALSIQGKAGEEETLPETVASATEWLVTSPGYLPLRIKSPSAEQLTEPILMTPASRGVSMVLEDILFKRGTAELAEEHSLSLINSLADFLKENPAVRILLEGHTDNLGNAQLNKELSLERASAIRQLLVDQGIAFERMRIAGWGGTKPISSNQTEEGRMKNRRVEMVIQ